MERKNSRPMTPFDNMATPPYLHTLKLMLPYTPSSNQRLLAIYIKFLELQHTMRHFRGFPASKTPRGYGESASPNGMFEDLKPFMSESEQGMMEQMEMMMNMMELFRGNDAAAGDGGRAFDPMDMMMGMLDPSQQELFHRYSDMFDNDTETEGGNEHERMDEQPGNKEYGSHEAGTD